MAHFLELPDEILQKISICLSKADQPSLFQACLVNKRLHTIIAPVLVRRWPPQPHTWRSPAIEDFALLLSRRPDLRGQVRELVIEYVSTSSEMETDRIDEAQTEHILNQTDRKSLAELVPQAWPSLAETTDWAEQVGHGVSDATIALILSWTKGLTGLDLTVPSFCPQEDNNCIILRWVTQVIRCIGDQPPGHSLEHLPLAKLQWVDFRHWDTELTVSARYAAPFFYLPTLRTFYGFKIGWEDWNEDDDHPTSNGEEPLPRSVTGERYLTEFPEGTSSVDNLTLEDADLPIHGLLALVRACRRLRSLDLCLGPVLDNNILSSRGLASVVLHHAGSLESFHFGIGEGPGIELTDEPSEGSFPFKECFQHLRRLKFLHIDVWYLYGESNGIQGGCSTMLTDTLPPSIEHLKLEALHYIWNWHLEQKKAEIQSFLEGISRLLLQCGPRARYPNLKHMDLSAALADDPAYSSILELKSLAEARDVKLSLGMLPENPSALK